MGDQSKWTSRGPRELREVWLTQLAQEKPEEEQGEDDSEDWGTLTDESQEEADYDT